MEMEAVNEFVRRIVFIGETCEDYFNWLCTHERDEDNEAKYEAGIVSAVMNLVMGERWSEEVKKRREGLSIEGLKEGMDEMIEISDDDDEIVDGSSKAETGDGSSRAETEDEVP